MTCIVDTASINLTTAAGQLSADLIVDPGAGLPPNPLVVNPAGVYVVGSDGWIPLPATLAFSSADASVHTYVATVSADLRSFLGPGDKIRLTQSGVPAYFFVTAITNATITLYGGQNYVLAALPISLPYFSKVKSPIGFNLDPTIWTEQTSDTVNRSQATPVAGTWYNPGTLLLSIPIGVWRVYYQVVIAGALSSGSGVNFFAALSTANNSGSDPELIALVQGTTQGGGLVTREKGLTLAAKTSYFLNAKSDTANTSAINFRGDLATTDVRAVCAYL